MEKLEALSCNVCSTYLFCNSTLGQVWCAWLQQLHSIGANCVVLLPCNKFGHEFLKYIKLACVVAEQHKIILMYATAAGALNFAPSRITLK